MKKGLIFSLLMILLALIESKARLWSGNAPDLLLSGLIGLAGLVGITELLLYILLGFLFVAGPMISQELLVMVVVVAFIHFLRLFVFGPSPFLTPIFSAVGILAFYLETVGFTVFSSPVFLLEIVLVSALVSLLPLVIIRLSEIFSS